MARARACGSRTTRDDVRLMAMDRDFLIDLFADFGPVTIRRMFSGFGISADGTNFALALRGWSLFPRRRSDHSAVRGGGLKAVSVSNPGQDRHGELVLAIAGAPVRRSGGTGALGEGGTGSGAARSVAQARRRLKASVRAKATARRPSSKAMRAGARRKVTASAVAAKTAATAKLRQTPSAVTSARQATWLWVSAAYSGSTSQITRLRPLRLAA